ncbi:aspartate carbamoyltransferase [Achromobacter sp. 413638]|uniref:aspartate carbamoyltransferase n=1 Tax=Achromobacter sp. 413638 TaxID=3342385 RepID=UPI00370C2A52
MLNPQLDRRGELIHLLSTEGLPRRHAERLLETAAAAAEPSWPTQGYGPLPPVFLLLPDTRRATRAAYWRAAEQLLLPVTALDPAEPLAEAVAGLPPGILVLGHPASGAALWAATHWAAAHARGGGVAGGLFGNSLFGGGFDHAAAPGLRVLNAGDGVHADPLAALALLRAILCAKPDLTRLAVTLVGDVRHSGLARSLIHALTTLGVPELRVAAPPALLPEGLPQLGVFPFSALDEGLRDADVIILLPLSAEAVAAGRLPSPCDYAAGYRLSPRALALARPDALLLSAAGLHAGIEAEVAFDAALARAGHERDALEHALRLAALRLLSDSLGRTLAPGGRA